jgi:hypothetical protein
MTTPRPGDVLRALAKAQTNAWPMQGQYQQQQPAVVNQYLQSFSQPRSESQTIAEETARTCAHSFARGLLAVADLFDAAAPPMPDPEHVEKRSRYWIRQAARIVDGLLPDAPRADEIAEWVALTPEQMR